MPLPFTPAAEVAPISSLDAWDGPTYSLPTASERPALQEDLDLLDFEGQVEDEVLDHGLLNEFGYVHAGVVLGLDCNLVGLHRHGIFLVSLELSRFFFNSLKTGNALLLALISANVGNNFFEVHRQLFILLHNALLLHFHYLELFGVFVELLPVGSVIEINVVLASTQSKFDGLAVLSLAEIGEDLQEARLQHEADRAQGLHTFARFSLPKSLGEILVVLLDQHVHPLARLSWLCRRSV